MLCVCIYIGCMYVYIWIYTHTHYTLCVYSIVYSGTIYVVQMGIGKICLLHHFFKLTVLVICCFITDYPNIPQLATAHVHCLSVSVGQESGMA